MRAPWIPEYHRDLARWARAKNILGVIVVAVIWTALCLGVLWFAGCATERASLDGSLAEKVNDLAQAERRSIPDMVEVLIAEAIKEREGAATTTNLGGDPGGGAIRAQSDEYEQLYIDRSDAALWLTEWLDAQATTTAIEFRSATGELIGAVDFADGTVRFEGNFDESAKVFFEHVARVCADRCAEWKP